jgi:hypothetical protein
MNFHSNFSIITIYSIQIPGFFPVRAVFFQAQLTMRKALPSAASTVCAWPWATASVRCCGSAGCEGSHGAV